MAINYFTDYDALRQINKTLMVLVIFFADVMLCLVKLNYANLLCITRYLMPPLACLNVITFQITINTL